jgi:site-specific DNA-methyltransferase (adenine-specific)
MNIDNITLIHGDCLVEMQRIPDKSVDMVLCDLPYGYTACSWDVIIPFDKLWQQYRRVIKDNGAIVLFGSEPFSSMLRVSNIEMYRYDWIWQKNKSANFAQAPYMPLKNTETISVFSYGRIAKNSKNRMRYYPQGVSQCNKVCKGKKADDLRPNRAVQNDYRQTITGYPTQILPFAKDGNAHPTQKPVALLEYLIKTYSNDGDTILDNTMGSGSTMVACVNTKRNGIGIELDDNYFKIAQKRVKEAIQHQTLF